MSSRIQPNMPLPTPSAPAPLRVLRGGAGKNVAEELAAQLRRSIQGEVRFDPGSRSLYATDLSLYRQVPIGVVIPRSVEDVVQTVHACRKYEVPILGRGCGTSLAGQCCNVAVVLDFSKYMNRLLELDPEKRIARVEPGITCDQLRDAAEAHHLTFGPDPATHKYCTLGGMIGNNSCGVHTIMAGRTADNVEKLEILCYDGTRNGRPHQRAGAGAHHPPGRPPRRDLRPAARPARPLWTAGARHLSKGPTQSVRLQPGRAVARP